MGMDFTEFMESTPSILSTSLSAGMVQSSGSITATANTSEISNPPPSFSSISTDSDSEISISVSSCKNSLSNVHSGMFAMECQKQQPYPPSDVTLSSGIPWCGFELVGDNLDSTIKPRYMRIDNQAKSLHYFNSYAVKDRIDFSTVPDETISLPLSPKLAVDVLLSSAGDDEVLQNNFMFLMKDILITHLPFFTTTFAGMVKHHLPHKYSAEMAKKSCVVSCYMH